MRSFISLPKTHSHALPPAYRGNDVRLSEALVALFLEEFTKPGDSVLNPFAGFGTTLIVAESMGRRGYGVEYEIERVEYARSLLKTPENMIHGDSRKLASLDLPSMDFSMTSPPYMYREDTEDPLAAYSTPCRGYEAYLDGIRDIYSQVRDLMKPDAYVVIEASNLSGRPGRPTTLAWDIAGVVGSVLSFVNEIVVGWDEKVYGYDHTYCLVFQKKV